MKLIFLDYRLSLIQSKFRLRFQAMEPKLATKSIKGPIRENTFTTPYLHSTGIFSYSSRILKAIFPGITTGNTLGVLQEKLSEIPPKMSLNISTKIPLESSPKNSSGSPNGYVKRYPERAKMISLH